VRGHAGTAGFIQFRANNSSTASTIAMPSSHFTSGVAGASLVRNALEGAAAPAFPNKRATVTESAAAVVTTEPHGISKRRTIR
jgi:hypothetical protein